MIPRLIRKSGKDPRHRSSKARVRSCPKVVQPKHSRNHNRNPAANLRPLLHLLLLRRQVESLLEKSHHHRRRHPRVIKRLHHLHRQRKWSPPKIMARDGGGGSPSGSTGAGKSSPSSSPSSSSPSINNNCASSSKKIPLLYEEDIIDGFSIFSFSSYQDVKVTAVVNYSLFIHSHSLSSPPDHISPDSNEIQFGPTWSTNPTHAYSQLNPHLLI